MTRENTRCKTIPRDSTYAIYAYIGVVLGINVGKYGIHGVSGISHSLHGNPQDVRQNGRSHSANENQPASRKHWLA